MEAEAEAEGVEEEDDDDSRKDSSYLAPSSIGVF